MATHSSILAWRIPMDRRAWQATVHRVAKCRIHLKWLNTRKSSECFCSLHSASNTENRNSNSNWEYYFTIPFVFVFTLFIPFPCCLVFQLCPTLCNPMDSRLLGSSVHGDSPGKNTGVGPCPPPGDLPNPGIEPRSPILQADSLPSEPTREAPRNTGWTLIQYDWCHN